MRIKKYKKLPEYLKFRWSLEDFYYYRMQNMSASEIEELATPEELWEREKTLNDDRFRDIFNDKRQLYRKFADIGSYDGNENRYIKRDFIFLDLISREEYETFIRKHENIILKPCDKYSGIGIYLIGEKNKRAGTDLPDFEILKGKHYIAEEYVRQAAEYSAVYSGSLNTIRVTTYITDDGKTEILFAVNQFGSGGSVVDNNDETAIWANIDIETGTVTDFDIDEKTGIVYDIHPDTHVPILGFKNQNWNEVCKMALKLAAVVPQCRLVGWDIAVREDYAVELIEGNVTPELDLYQMISGKGLRKRLEIKKKENG